MLISKMLVAGTNRRIHTVEKHCGMVRDWDATARALLLACCTSTGVPDTVAASPPSTVDRGSGAGRPCADQSRT